MLVVHVFIDQLAIKFIVDTSSSVNTTLQGAIITVNTDIKGNLAIISLLPAQQRHLSNTQAAPS
jgi:hypothetical protein